jgi:hypothetical protein
MTVKDPFCAICCPEILQRPKFLWGQYQNCPEHNKDVIRVTQQLKQQQVPAERSIYDRFEAARELLLLRGVKFTSEQEAAFKDKMFELAELYEAKHPGKTAPALRYDANGCLQFVWPSGWHQEMREARA